MQCLNTYRHIYANLNMQWANLRKKTSKEAHEKNTEGKIYSIDVIFLTKREVSIHEAIKRASSLSVRNSNIDVSLSIFKKMHRDDTNVFASNIIDKYQNWLDHLHSVCLADFPSSYVSKKADVLVEPDEVKSCIVLVFNIDIKLNLSVIVLNNELGEMQKQSTLCYLFSQSF